MSKPSVETLALLSSNELKADKSELVRLQHGIIEQMRVMRRLRGEEALRGLLVGMVLLRVKHSMPYGTFGVWLKENITEFSDRYANYLMRLGLVFVEKMKVARPELLAMPGDQTELRIDTLEGEQRRFVAKAMKFVGELSLGELLIKHEIKEQKKLGGARTGSKDENAATATPEQIAAHAREELSAAHENLRQLLLIDNVCQHLSRGEIRSFAKSIDAMLTAWRAANKETLNEKD